MRASIAIASLVLAAMAPAARASDASATLNEAQASYDRGMELQRTDATTAQVEFERAAHGFAELVDQGSVNGPLLYNLGNAQMQLGKTGAAIGSYLRAQRLMPGDSRLQSNLAHARSLVKDRFDRGNGLLLEDVAAWWHLLPLQGRFALAIALWTAAWGLLIVRWSAPSVFPGRWRRFSASASWAMGVLGGILLATVAVDVTAPTLRPQGVTVADGVVVRKGNGDGFEPAFTQPLSQGVEFRVLEERPGWIQIRLPDGKSGWIKALQASTA